MFWAAGDEIAQMYLSKVNLLSNITPRILSHKNLGKYCQQKGQGEEEILP